jgi:hypothetical protein
MSERRRSVRRTVFEVAKIIFNHRHVRRCTVRDISAGGACLDVMSADIPDTFDLIRDLDAHTCEVKWRRRDRLGVQFDSFFALIRSK